MNKKQIVNNEVGKILFILLFYSKLCLAINAQTTVSTEPSKRNVILEEYTGVNCTWCPDGHKIANELMAANSGHFLSINIHQGAFASTNPDYRTEFGDALASLSGLNSYPSGTINRHIFSGSNMALNRYDWEDCAKQIMAEDSYVNIAALSMLDVVSRELTVTVELYYTEDANVDVNNINVALLQNNILGPQTGMMMNPDQVVGNLYNHQHMLRHLITGQWGDEITEVFQGNFMFKTYNYLIPQHLRGVEFELIDLEIIVFVSEGQANIITGAKSEMLIINGKPVMKAFKEHETFSCDEEVVLCATVFNFTDSDVTSLEFKYTLDGGDEQTFFGDNGAIAPMATDIVYFSPISVISGEEHKIVATLTGYNDDEEIIGGIPFEINVQKTITNAMGDAFRLILATDRYASQNSFKFFDSNGNIILQDGGWSNLTFNGITPRQFVFLPPTSGCYKLEVYDTAGNGINSGNGDGYIEFYDIKNNLLFRNDGKFGYQANYYINVSQNSLIGNYKVENELIIFPNPVKDILTVETQLAIISVEIINLQGQKIIFTDKKEIDVSRLSSGVYLVFVNTNEGIVVNKVIKK